IVDLNGAGGAEVAHLCVVWTLADIYRLDQLRDQEVDICVALPVAMCRHVDGHSVNLDGEISAVVKVEAAQEILVGLTLSGMLGDNQAGHDLQRLAGPQERYRVHLSAADTHGAGRGRLERRSSIGRGTGRDAAGACSDRLVRSNGGSAA